MFGQTIRPPIVAIRCRLDESEPLEARYRAVERPRPDAAVECPNVVEEPDDVARTVAKRD